MNVYNFYYGVMSNAITMEAKEVFTCQAVCLKHGLIKLARFFADLPDFSLDKYQLAVDYSVNGLYKETSQDDFMFFLYYVSNFQQYNEVENND